MRVQDLILLGLLMEGPKHGYELKQKVDESLREVGRITSGTLYYALGRLEEKKWVTGRREKAGNRPERVVYAITTEGKKAFRELLRKSLTTPERPYFLFDVGLYFAPYVELDFLEEAVDTKLRELADSRRRMKELEEAHPRPWPFHLFYIKERWRLLMDAHERWYRRLRTKVRKKRKEEETWSISSSPTNSG